MTYAIVAASSLLAVLLVLALVREVRARRAMQKLLARIFHHRRPNYETDCTESHRDVDGDAVHAPDHERL